jgi:hypothetical protein
MLQRIELALIASLICPRVDSEAVEALAQGGFAGRIRRIQLLADRPAREQLPDVPEGGHAVAVTIMPICRGTRDCGRHGSSAGGAGVKSLDIR